MKEYPLRIDEDLVDVCECGHDWGRHSAMKEENCLTCMCPKYNFEQQMSMSDAHKLSREIRKERETSGFTT